jgi:hypothetical protein
MFVTYFWTCIVVSWTYSTTNESIIHDTLTCSWYFLNMHNNIMDVFGWTLNPKTLNPDTLTCSWYFWNVHNIYCILIFGCDYYGGWLVALDTWRGWNHVGWFFSLSSKCCEELVKELNLAIHPIFVVDFEETCGLSDYFGKLRTHKYFIWFLNFLRTGVSLIFKIIFKNYKNLF